MKKYTPQTQGNAKYKNFLGLAMFLLGSAALLGINYLYKNQTISNGTAVGATFAVGIAVMALYWKYFRRKR